jgi:hypothetical protein
MPRPPVGRFGEGTGDIRVVNMSSRLELTRFRTQESAFDFVFSYPSDWKLRETRGADYHEVDIIGPRNREGTFNVGLSIRVTGAGEGNRLGCDVDTLRSDYLTRSKTRQGFRQISCSSGSLAGMEIREVEIAYVIPLPIDSVRPKMTTIIERVVFLKRDTRVYEIAYTASEDEYREYLPVFEELIHTFAFTER